MSKSVKNTKKYKGATKLNRDRNNWRMSDLDIPTFIPDEDRTSPLFQGDVYVIMWRSDRSGGTYSIIRKSEEGMRRYVYALELVGYAKEEIQVFKQHKPWIPAKKSDESQTKPFKGRRV